MVRLAQVVPGRTDRNWAKLVDGGVGFWAENGGRKKGKSEKPKGIGPLILG